MLEHTIHLLTSAGRTGTYKVDWLQQNLFSTRSYISRTSVFYLRTHSCGCCDLEVIATQTWISNYLQAPPNHNRTHDGSHIYKWLSVL